MQQTGMAIGILQQIAVSTEDTGLIEGIFAGRTIATITTEDDGNKASYERKDNTGPDMITGVENTVALPSEYLFCRCPLLRAVPPAG